MTVREVMTRLAGDDHEWREVDGDLMGMGDIEVEAATVIGHDATQHVVVFRVPMERLVKKETV
jgi:hypothetical protein